LINPFFCHTGIFKFPVLIALLGIPLATLEDVVAAMIYASTASKGGKEIGEEINGSCFMVDWKYVP